MSADYYAAVYLALAAFPILRRQIYVLYIDIVIYIWRLFEMKLPVSNQNVKRFYTA